MDTASDIPTREPDKVTAGDSWKWKRSLSHYKASDGWTLTYALANAASKISITAAADGDDHSVSLAAAATTAYAAGTYSWQAYVTKGTDRYQVDEGRIEVKPNLAAQANYDNRTHVKKVLDAIEAVLESRATQDQMRYTINGRELSKTAIADLLTLRSRYKAEYAAEVKAERIAKGLGHKGRVLVRF